jgi:hypothetical protein
MTDPVTIGLMLTLDVGLWIRKSKNLNGSPGRARSDVPVGPVNDDLPESLTADLVFTGLTAQNSAINPVCLAEVD